MLKQVAQSGWLMGLTVLLLLCSILLQILMGAMYYRLILETDNMSATGNKLLKQCKLKFANCYRLNSGVANIPVFVDKFLHRLRIGKLSFRTLYHMSGQLMLLSVFVAGVGACLKIIIGAETKEILPFYIVSLFGLYLYFAISSAVDVKGKIAVLKVNLVDYLENHMVSRLEASMEEEQQEEGDLLFGKRQSERKAGTGISAKSLLSSLEEEELEDLLKELLA